MAGTNGHSGNGRANGVESHAPSGGKGAALLGEDPRHLRRDLAHLRRAARQGWNIPDELLAELPAIAAKIAKDAKAGPRTQLRAVECVRAMEADNVAAALALDKVNRLDDDKPTENVSHK